MTEQEWSESTDPQPMLEFLKGRTSNRKLRLFACACVRRIWHLLSDPRSRLFVELAEQFVGASSDAAVAAAQRKARRAVAEVRVAAQGPWRLWTTLAGAAATAAAGATRVLDDPAAAVLDASRATAQPDERATQSHLLREVVGNPFRPVRLDPLWQTPNTVALAQAASDERQLPCGTLDNGRLAVLADALEEAGCQDLHVLGHLRDWGPHVHGCHIVDAVLGRS